jgi:phosphate transport system substrate-binding protein
MSSRIVVRIMVVVLMACWWPMVLVSKVPAAEVLRMSSSAQVYDAYVKEAIPAFQERTGIQVDVFVSSSASSIGRLMNGMCDLATTVEGFKFRYGEYGYLEIPFCKDPLVVVTHPDVPVDSITSEQVMGIFSGHIKKWKELGGPDERLIIVVPGDTTAAYKNFDGQAMGGRPICFDFMSYISTLAVKAVQRVPYSISFMGQGVIAGQPGIKTLKINGTAAGENGYPYHQVFSFAVEGNPVGLAEKFIDFTFSEEGQAIIRKRHMTPLPSPAD